MEFRSISFLFWGLPPTPTLLVTVYYYLLHILTGTFFSSVFSFLKYVRQLDGISPRDKTSQEVGKKINALPSTRRREKTKRTKALL